jgi:hypothetical protein
LTACTIDTNTAAFDGGLNHFGFTANDVLSINQSTVSGNHASISRGGLYTNKPLIVRNSTIANNQAAACGGIYAANTVYIASSIFAGNSSDDAACVDLRSSGAISGGLSLVGVVNQTLPDGTLVGNPRLTPLADHGGLTRTHGLSLNSPAIDAGSNPNGYEFDQRKDGFARVVGEIDIGAFERQADDDELFYGGFD